MNPTAASFKPTATDGQGHNGGRLPFRPQGFGDSSPPTRDSRSRIPCYFHQRGRCREGDACPFSHAEVAQSEPAAQIVLDVHMPSVQEEATRTLYGAKVHFHAGASITKVSLSSDFSTVHISQLPHGSTRGSVLDLLRSHDLDVLASSDIRVTHQNTFSSAKVTVEDPEFAKSTISKLGMHAASWNGGGTRPVVIVVESSMLSGSSDLRIDCKKVRCSWHKPCKTVWLNFGNGDIADRVSKSFVNGTYKIAGRPVTSNIPTRGAGRHNSKAWSVCLTDVPAEATEKDVERSIISQRDKPRDIQLGEPSYRADAETCSTTIKSLFTKVGTLEWWELVHDTTGKRMLANARFQNEVDAREAARSLNNSQLPFNKKAKLTVSLVYSAKFKVPTAIYEATEYQIMANIKSWKASHLSFIPYENSDPPKWYRVLKLEGENAEAVAKARNTIERIIAGTVAKDGASVLWHPALRGSGVLLEKFGHLQRQTGVLIFRNRAKSQFQLYGPPERCEAAQAALADMLKAEALESFEIELDAQQFVWACRGGYEKIANEVGSQSVKFDIVSTPKRIIIAGTTGDHERALNVMNGGSSRPNKERNANGRDCSVCWTEAENPIQTQCNHVYCLDCFENLCMSATTQDSAVKVQCTGDSGTCAAVFDLPELQEHLSSTAFDELLEQSFASYMRRCPHLLRHCPSADCGYIYRVSSTAKTQTCPGCLVPVCTSCHAQHGTMTCAEHKDIASGGYAAYEQLKREKGIKDCPKCGTPLEKTGGCDHMTCKCGAHICWICLRTFKSSQPCYDHMNKDHWGG
ncbi:hypothetical protein F4677DRAFT_445421 [Hypoxylon crocopeplum]|nr:hypothetical protein F4677DRAFT_445421 [Hypoxylon crocopeplum]